jgi:hypothetical protein
MIAEVITGFCAFLGPIAIAVLAIKLTDMGRKRRRRKSINDRLHYWTPNLGPIRRR